MVWKKEVLCLVSPKKKKKERQYNLRFYIFKKSHQCIWGSSGGVGGKEPACQCRRCKRLRFNPWVGQMPWRRAWEPTPVSLAGESEKPCQATVNTVAEPDTTEATQHTHIWCIYNFKIKMIFHLGINHNKIMSTIKMNLYIKKGVM